MRDLFDFSFARFLTPKLIKALFVVFVFVASVVTLGAMVNLVAEIIKDRISNDVKRFYIVATAAAPFALAIAIVVARVVAELSLVAFKIEEELRAIRSRNG